MAKQIINLGTMADNKSGDPLRTAFQKVNENFTELYNQTGGGVGVNVGDQTNEPSQVTDIVFDGATVVNADGVSTVTITPPTIPPIPTDINQLTDADGLLGQGGNANTGSVTFDNVAVIGAETQAVGTQLFFQYNDEGGSDNKGASGVALPINADSQQIQAGWIARFNSGEVYTVDTVFEANGGLVAAMNGGTGFYATLPVTFESPDYIAYAPPELILKADQTQGYGVKVFNSIDNDTHLAPVSRDKGVALGFAYGTGSHIRVEGAGGQWMGGNGDRVGIHANDGNGAAADWSFDHNGVATLPQNGVVRGENTNLVSTNYSQLQWVDPQGYNVDNPNNVTNFNSNWAYVDQDGFHVETNVGTRDNKALDFGKDGKLRYPDGTKQSTAYDDGNRVWFAVFGDGNNAIPSWEDNNTGNLWFDVSCALPDNTVMVGGGWGWGDCPVLAQYDKNGKVLWQWMGGMEEYQGEVSSIAYNPNNQRIRVAITSTVNRNYWGTRLVYFSKNPNPTNFADVWVVESSAALYDANDDGDVYVTSSMFVNGSWVGVGQKSGQNTMSGTFAPAGGSGWQKLLINKTDLGQVNGQWPSNQGNGGWTLRSTHDGGNMLNGNDVTYLIGRFIDVPFTVTTGNGTGGRIDISIDYNTNTYVCDASLWGEGYAVGDTITILGSNVNGVDTVNDIVLTVIQSDTGMMDAVVVNAGCVPQTDNFIVNFSIWGYWIDFSDTSIVLDLYVAMADDPFIYSDWSEFVKVNSKTGYGHYNHVIWDESQQCYFAAGHSQDNFGDNGLLDKILHNGTVAWSKAGMNEIQGLATNGDYVFVTVSESSSIIALDPVTGDKVWETAQADNMPWGWGVENLVYKNGYLYAAGRGGSMWSWQGIVVQRIDPATGLSDWTRFVHVQNDSINLNWNFNSQFLSVTDDSVYIACNGQFKTGSNNCGGLIRIPVDGGPELEALNNPGFDVDSSFRIDGKFEGTPLYVDRIVVTDGVSIRTRTDLNFTNTDIQYNGDYSQQSYYPTIKTTVTNLTPNSGITFADGTPKAKHNPVDVAEVCADWNDSNTYTLQLSDRGKFIRTQWYYQDNIYINVPSDSQVNFPVGTVITLINMWDWNANGYAIYIQSQFDNLSQRPHVYLAGQGPFPQNGGWSPQWKFQGRGTATLMKVGSNEWLLTGNNISDSDY